MARLGINLDSREVPPTIAFDPALKDPITYNASTSLTAFDTLGNPHILTTYFVKQPAASAMDYKLLRQSG
ncbi:MAG: hypothetical protein MZW92_52405 [Comamonadaceae bacterium]|nr:hypothetical protein [Comamonadaceae bacterium]